MIRKKRLEKPVSTHIQHIERYEHNPLVRRVLAQDSTFKREVENFYGVSTWWDVCGRAPPVRRFGLIKDNPEKDGYPTDLVEILHSFGDEEEFDTNKLSYANVREDYHRWHEPLRRIKLTAMNLGLVLTGLGGMATAIILGIKGKNLEIVIPPGIVGGAAIATHIFYNPHPKGTNYELTEFVKLYDSAKRADSFMGEHYRDHFIKKTLASVPP